MAEDYGFGEPVVQKSDIGTRCADTSGSFGPMRASSGAA